MARHVIYVRQTSPLRAISAEEVVAALPPDDRGVLQTHVEVRTDAFADAIAQGDWGGQDRYLREEAARIREAANREPDVAVHYFGLAEVPHVLSLGAHLGSERAVVLHDHDRQSGTWAWAAAARTLEVATRRTESLGVVVPAPGFAVIRVSISAEVTDADVREAVGEGALADVTVGPAGGVAPAVGLVRSAADVEAVRLKFREALAALRAGRPNVELVHLFVAAPPSVCFAVGQELVPRNSPPVQTYRYRNAPGEPRQRPALVITADGEGAAQVPLTDEELELAAHVRTVVWPAAVKEVEDYAAAKREDGHGQSLWYETLEPRGPLALADPFPALPPLPKVVPHGVTVDPEPFGRDYGYEATAKRWRLGDRLLLGLRRAADGDEPTLRSLIRLFLFHEYLHLYHSIKKHTAEEVGKFANCLEHVDYTADAYALVHQLDWARRHERHRAATDEDRRRFLAGQIDLAIRSFWAFDEAAGNEWQVRRIRRYLNWYWRLVQVENAPDLTVAMLLFRRQPRLEIGGLSQFARGRRVLARLNELDRTTHLELAVVLEDERLFRQSDSPNTNLPALLGAFGRGDHRAITEFFRSLYDMAEGTGGVLPAVRPPRANGGLPQ